MSRARLRMIEQASDTDYSPQERTFDGPGYCVQSLHHRREIFASQRLFAIALGPVWVRMHLDDQSIGAAGDRCERQRRHKVPFAGAMARVGDDGQVRYTLC